MYNCVSADMGGGTNIQTNTGFWAPEWGYSSRPNGARIISFYVTYMRTCVVYRYRYLAFLPITYLPMVLLRTFLQIYAHGKHLSICQTSVCLLWYFS